jgi:hypothetical protein
MKSAKKLSIPTLAERIEALEDEVDQALDDLAEQTRPPNVPAGAMRRMWEAKAAGNLFHAYLVAIKEQRSK